MIHAVYTAAFAALVAAYAPLAVARRLMRGVPLNVRARLGYGAGRSTPPGRSGWVHAVSVGEAIAAEPLVEGLRRRYPALPMVVTTVTETGARVVRSRLGRLATHRYFPLDFPGAARRVVDAIDPAFLICMETEIWPNVLRVLRSRDVPVMIANGRLSDRSFRRYLRVRRLLRPVLDGIRVYAMQSSEDARRIIALGASPDRVVVTGNVKHDVLQEAASAGEPWRLLFGLARDQRVWVAGSTHGGEDEAVLEAHRVAIRACPELALIIAPRHPERVPEVLGVARAQGWRTVKRSDLPAPREPGAVIVLDTVGELAQVYALADVVFVGGSLVPSGGHNMLEAALRRKPVLFGPHTTNFRDAAALLLTSGGALVVDGADDLGRQLTRLLGDAALRERLGRAGYDAVASRHGAVRHTLELVERFLCSEDQ